MGCCTVPHRMGPRMLQFPCSESSTQMHGSGTFASSRGMSGLGCQDPVHGASHTASCSDLTPSPGRGKKRWWGNDVAGPTRAHSRERASLELESQRPAHLTALVPRRADENGAGCLDTDSGSGAGWWLSVFCGTDWSGAEESPVPQNWTTFNKNFFPLPTNFCVMLVFGSRWSNPILFGNISMAFFLLFFLKKRNLIFFMLRNTCFFAGPAWRPELPYQLSKRGDSSFNQILRFQGFLWQNWDNEGDILVYPTSLCCAYIAIAQLLHNIFVGDRCEPSGIYTDKWDNLNSRVVEGNGWYKHVSK